MSGWIKLHRNLIEWEWYDDIPSTRLLIHLLLKVNYEPKKWKGIWINPGSIVTSFEKLSSETGLTFKQVRIALDKLEKSGEISRDRALKGQMITLLKWDKLQDEKEKRASKEARKGQEKGKKRATTKEGKEDKEIKEIKKTSDFDFFWNLYDKKVGSKSKIEKKWNRLSDETKKIILDYIPKYKLNQPDKQYRKNPETFLNNESWLDEIIPRNSYDFKKHTYSDICDMVGKIPNPFERFKKAYIPGEDEPFYVSIENIKKFGLQIFKPNLE